MVWCWVWMFTSTLGTMVQEKQVSMKDRLARKKYIGVWRRGSEPMARMVSRFADNSDRVQAQEGAKQERKLFWMLREAQEQEVRDAGLVSDFHLK